MSAAWSEEELVSMVLSNPLISFGHWDMGLEEAIRDLRCNYEEYAREFEDSALRAMYYQYEKSYENEIWQE